MGLQTIYGSQSNRYLKLIRRLPLRPLNSDEELDDAVRLIDELLDQSSLDDAEQDYLDVLSDLVEKYETEAHPIPPVSDADMLRHLIEAREITQTELAKATGISESTISSILSGKRKINRRHIGKLADYFSVEPAVFLIDP